MRAIVLILRWLGMAALLVAVLLLGTAARFGDDAEGRAVSGVWVFDVVPIGDDLVMVPFRPRNDSVATVKVQRLAHRAKSPLEGVPVSSEVSQAAALCWQIELVCSEERPHMVTTSQRPGDGSLDAILAEVGRASRSHGVQMPRAVFDAMTTGRRSYLAPRPAGYVWLGFWGAVCAMLLLGASFVVGAAGPARAAAQRPAGE